ncbi:ATP-binding protein [Archangium gephyra]|uniref:sensor histidine kinase n=1 Tax=Archangium gephyra TaxID=48 RepID=UPI003B7EC07E
MAPSEPPPSGARRSAVFSLRTRVGLLVCLFAVVAVTSVGAVAGRLAERDVDARVGEGLATVAQLLAERTQAQLASRLEQVRMLAELERQGLMPERPEARRAVVEQLQRGTPGFAWVGFLDASGVVRYSTGGLLEGANSSERPAFREGSRGLFVGDAHEAVRLAGLLESPEGPLRLLDLAVPVHAPDGTLKGVMAAHLTWDWGRALKRALAETAGAGLEVRLLRRDGSLLSEPPTGAETFRRAVLPAPLEPHVQRGGWAEATWEDGRAYLTGIAPLRATGTTPALGWTVMVLQPSEVAFQPAVAVRERLTGLGLLAGLLLAVVGWALAGRVARPLTDIAAAAERLRAGEYDVRLPHGKRGDEIGALSASLEALLRMLEAREAELRRALAVREDFLTVAAHELRTPLTALTLQLTFMGRQASAAGVSGLLATSLQRATRQVKRLGQLSEAVLDTSRIESGELELELEPLEVGDFTRELLERVRDLSPGADLRLEACAPAAGCFDRRQLEQLLTHLVLNAIKYGKGKPVTVRVEATAGEALISVRDEGIGMRPEDVERVFGRFERAISTRHYGGFGLGLFIAQAAARAHGGHIRVESEPGHGSCFTVALPLRAPEPPRA